MTRIIPALAFLMFPLCAASEIKITDSNHKPVVQVIEKNGQCIFAYSFTTLQNIYDVRLSPSGHYLFIWHREKNPRKLKIFRIEDGNLLADFAPGYGGELRWTKGDRLFHAWGCGTCCNMIRTYDITGHILHEECADGYLFTDQGFYITFPAGSLEYFENETCLPITIYDANTDQVSTLPETAPFIPVDYQLTDYSLFIYGIDNEKKKLNLPPNSDKINTGGE